MAKYKLFVELVNPTEMLTARRPTQLAESFDLKLRILIRLAPATLPCTTSEVTTPILRQAHLVPGPVHVGRIDGLQLPVAVAGLPDGGPGRLRAQPVGGQALPVAAVADGDAAGWDGCMDGARQRRTITGCCSVAPSGLSCGDGSVT